MLRSAESKRRLISHTPSIGMLVTLFSSAVRTSGSNKERFPCCVCLYRQGSTSTMAIQKLCELKQVGKTNDMTYCYPDRITALSPKNTIMYFNLDAGCTHLVWELLQKVRVRELDLKKEKRCKHRVDGAGTFVAQEQISTSADATNPQNDFSVGILLRTRTLTYYEHLECCVPQSIDRFGEGTTRGSPRLTPRVGTTKQRYTPILLVLHSGPSVVPYYPGMA